LTGSVLIDGTGAPPLLDSAVLVDDAGRIAAVGPQDSISRPPAAETLDVSGCTLLPGLIDCHDHMGTHGYSVGRLWGLEEPQSTSTLRSAAALRQALFCGYTTVRDAAGLDAGFKLAIEEGLIPGPRLVLALNLICATGAVGDVMSPSRHSRRPPPSLSIPVGVADGVTAVRATVRAMVQAGADVIKTATTPGERYFQHATYGRDELLALVDEAHSLGRRVMCHAIGGPGLRLAVEAGVDSLEHGHYLADDPDLLSMMAEKKIFYDPTLSPAKISGRLLPAHHVASVQAAVGAGVRVVAGSDSGGHVRGKNAVELECLVEVGMSPQEALRAATETAAQCLGMEDEVGTIKPGKRADLLIGRGDPTQDIALLQDPQRIALVLKDGKICVDRRSTQMAG